MYSRTQFADAFPRFELNKTFVGFGNLCLKTIEIAKIPDSYVMKPNGKSVQEENEGNIKKQAKDFLGYGNSEICTTENKHNYRFGVSAEVYSDDKYFEKLNNARTLQEVDEIIRDYREHSKDEKIAEKKQTKDQKETPKKKRWWQ